MQNLSPTYNEIRRLRSTGNCAAAISILRSRQPASDDEAFEAVVCLLVCGEVESALQVCRTRRWQMPWAVRTAGALSEGIGGGSASRALDLAREAVNAPGVPYDAVAIYLLLLQNNDLVEEADAYITRRLANPPAGEPFLLTLVAEVAAACGKWRDAYRAASGVLAADPDDYRALVVMSVVNYEVGNFHESLGNAVRANVLRKGSAPAVLQLMRCRNKLGNHYAAIAAFDALSDPDAANPDIRVELGKAYHGLSDRDRALAEYTAALASGSRSTEAIRALVALHGAAGDTGELDALKQKYRDEIDNDIECECSLGLAALNRGDTNEASRLFGRTLALAARNGEAARELPWPVPEPRIRHDCEQLELLERRGRLERAGREALAVLRRYCAPATPPEATFAPAGAEGETLKHALCTHFYIPDLPFAGRALGENDYAALEDAYLAKRLVVIDDFLSPEALAALRRHCEEATIWKMNYDRGYLGALLAQGFGPKVLLTIAGDLKAAMPRVIGNSPLMQAWAFKYDQRMQGINMHADFAEINANFWVTPDEACEDPTTGGMVVYDVPVPKNWTFFEYNNESEKLAAYVKVHKANAQRVPYRANRCVLFDSSLIHITDELHFKPGYENRRVNVTLLYGLPRNIK